MRIRRARRLVVAFLLGLVVVMAPLLVVALDQVTLASRR
jgi:hypothetical protein